MRLDELPRSDKIEDRRSEDGGASFRIPGGRGGLGIGTIIVLGLVGYWLGIDPSLLIGGAEVLTGGGSSQQQQSSPTPREAGAPSDQMGQFVSAVLGSTEAQWQKIFGQYGKTYQPPTLVMFSGATRSACGFAQSAMGPFYCPNDRKVYLDTSFFQDLERRFRACDAGSKSCQFSQAYVIAHEVGWASCPRCSKCSRVSTRSKPTKSRCGSSCKPIVLPAYGRITRRKRGTSSNLATSRRRCRPHRPSATTGCNGRRRATWCPMHSPTAPRNSAPAGS
jgi:hypothetical protein